MKEISKKINDFLTLDRYLKLVGASLLVVGLGLFVYCTWTVKYQFQLPTLIFSLQTLSNPLFYLVFGFSLLCFRHFLKITDIKKESDLVGN